MEKGAHPRSMHRMNQDPPTTPRSLLLHDGELADVSALLAALDIPFVERLGAENQLDRQISWDLVIASARRILDLQLPASAAPPTQIAILAHDARTLRSSLRRTGTTLMVRRPVHPAALRALVVHSLYRGPEKRRSTRVNVGAPVRIKVGWRPRPALLVDLSVSGCRLMTDRVVEPGRSFRLLIPAELCGGKPLSLEASVVECTASPEALLGRFVTTASFESLSARLHTQLQFAVTLHADGPATCEGAPRLPTAAPRPAAAPAPVDRRESDRLPLDQRVVALDQEAARVLMGRDLSRGGMRVNPNPLLAVGMNLRLAVHAETREQPLILHATVERDDGELGLVLRFRDLSPELTRYLDYVIHALPLVIDDDDDEGCLITELLEAS